MPNAAEMPKLFVEYVGMGDSDKPRDFDGAWTPLCKAWSLPKTLQVPRPELNDIKVLSVVSAGVDASVVTNRHSSSPARTVEPESRQKRADSGRGHGAAAAADWFVAGLTFPSRPLRVGQGASQTGSDRPDSAASRNRLDDCPWYMTYAE